MIRLYRIQHPVERMDEKIAPKIMNNPKSEIVIPDANSEGEPVCKNCGLICR